MSWVFFVLMGFALCVIWLGWRILRKKKYFEKVVYDSLVAQDGVGFFWKTSVENGIDKDEMEKVVGALKKKGVLTEKTFANRRRLDLVDFLRKRDKRVLDFLNKNKGEASFGEIMKGLGMDDNMLTKIGKKLVRLRKILKVARGYEVFFVLKKK